MKVFNQITNNKTSKPLVLAIGNFDGIHLGHQAVIKKARQISLDNNLLFGLMTFEPHPKTFFNPELKNFRLTPKKMKEVFFNKLNVEYLYMVNFNNDFANIDPETFVKEYLIDTLNVEHIVIGDDFMFGKKGKGNAKTLKSLADKYHFNITTIPKVTNNSGDEYSSTAIRNALLEGNPIKAKEILGHFFAINGQVILGRQTGASLGFPTANVSIGEYFKPKEGIYAIIAELELNNIKRTFKGVANIGGSPTFDIHDYIVEAHLFDFSGDIYKKDITISLVDYIREPVKFDSIDNLIKEIKLDAEKAKAILKNQNI